MSEAPQTVTREELEQAVAKARAEERRKRRWLVVALAGALLALVGITLGGLGWIARDRAARRAAVEQEVAAALSEAEVLTRESRWAEAIAAARRAESLLAVPGEGRPGATAQRVRDMLADLEMAQRLEEIRLQKANLVGGRFFNTEAADRAYAEAFRHFGVDVEGKGGGPEAAAPRIRESAVREELVSALDDWAGLAQNRERRTRLLEVARQADPDPWRDRLRDPKLWRDRAALERLAREADRAGLSPAQLVLLARLLGRAGGDSVPLLESTQRRYPGDFWSNFELANALAWRHGRPDEAVLYYRAALAIRPQNVAVYANLGAALAETGRLSEAIAAYRKAIELKPDDAGAHNGLGRALHANGDLDGAVASHRQAIRLKPEVASFHRDLGKVLFDKKDYDSTIAAYRQAIRLDPNLVGAYTLLGDALAAKGKLEEAVACYRNALRTDPPGECGSAALGLANSLARLGKHARAVEAYRSALRFVPEDAGSDVRLEAARAAVRAAEGKDAEKLGDEAKARLRKQALDWLKADLAARRKAVDKGGAKVRREAARALARWRKDPDLAGVRDKEALAKLPAGERVSWQKLWAEVDSLRKRTAEEK
jgi:eukaryotic-like serine/threonine-protein kinase